MSEALLSITEFVRREPGIVSDMRCYQMIRQGLIPTVKLGRRIYIDPAQWAEFKRSGGRAWPGGWRREAPGA